MFYENIFITKCLHVNMSSLIKLNCRNLKIPKAKFVGFYYYYSFKINMEFKMSNLYSYT